MLSPYGNTGGGAYNTLFGGGGASAQPVPKTDPRPRPTGPGGTVVVAPPDPNNPQAPPPGIDPSTVVRDHRAGHPTWRPAAQQNMTDEDYAAWLAANVTHPDQPTLGVDASGAPIPNPNYVPPGAAPAPPAAAAPASLPPMTAIDRNDFMLPGGGDIMGMLQARAGQVGDRAGPALGPAAMSADSDARGRQTALADLLQRFATGQDSASMSQLAQARDANVANQLAMAAGARPGGAQLAGLNAAQNIGNINTALAGQQSLAGINERRSAMDALSGVLGTQRGQDLGNSQFNAGQQNAYTLGGAQLGLTARGQNDQAYSTALNQMLDTAGRQQQGGQAYSTANSMQELAQRKLEQERLLAQLNASTSLAVAGKGSSLDTILAGLGAAGAAYAGRPSAPAPAVPDPSYGGYGSAPY